MKKYLVSFALLSVFAAFLVFGVPSSAQDESRVEHDPELISFSVVISQFQAGGGVANDEFVELHNVSAAPVDLNGYSLVYRSAGGTNDVGPFVAWTGTTIIQPGQFYLIASTNYDGGVNPDITYNPSTCSCSMSANGGGLAIRPSTAGTPIDSVGWGTATNIFIEGQVTAAPANNNSQSRLNSGCKDTDNNANDFGSTIPAAARNRSSAPAPCAGGSGELQGFGNASPSSVAQGGTTLLTVTVVPATLPPSTGITVLTDLSAFGGSATQSFFDDGTHGDATTGDNVFSFLEVLPSNAAAGSFSLAVNIADAELHTATTSISLTVTVVGPHSAAEHEVLGNPSGAQTEPIGFANDYLMEKTQYVLSYSRDRGTPNWVEWHMDSSWTGTAPRQDDYRADTSLPNLAGWYQVQGSDYTGSPTGEGFDRGHMCPSGDRMNTIADNSATFLMTNMIPQAPVNNQVVWADLENYCRDLVDAGNELYIYSGGAGIGGSGLRGGITNTIVNGRVTVPAWVWKVIVVLPVGSNDAQRVNQFTRVITVILPNKQSVTRPWTQYRTSVGAVETLTGYRFFRKIRPVTRTGRIKKHVDTVVVPVP